MLKEHEKIKNILEEFEKQTNQINLFKAREIFETSRFVFAQSPYFSSWVSKSNLDGAQEPEHAPDFSPRVLDIFKFNLEKHFFIEEKIIFSAYQIENQEDDEDIENLLKDHKNMLFLIKNIEETLSKDKKPIRETGELKQIMSAHASFENQSFYPRIDKELSEEQKQMMIQRAEEEIR